MVAGGLGWDPVQIPVANATAQAAKGQKHPPGLVPQPFLPLPPPPPSNESYPLDQQQPQDPWAQGPALRPHCGLKVHAHWPGAPQSPTPPPSDPRKYLPSPPQAALGVTVTSRQESDSEL